MAAGGIGGVCLITGVAEETGADSMTVSVELCQPSDSSKVAAVAEMSFSSEVGPLKEL